MVSEEEKDLHKVPLEDMTLRDKFAMEADIPLDKVVEIISLMKARELQDDADEQGRTLSFQDVLRELTENKKYSDISLKQVVELRALLRYMEADEMLKVREGSIASWIKGEHLTENRWEAVINDD